MLGGRVVSVGRDDLTALRVELLRHWMLDVTGPYLHENTPLSAIRDCLVRLRQLDLIESTTAEPLANIEVQFWLDLSKNNYLFFLANVAPLSQA